VTDRAAEERARGGEGGGLGRGSNVGTICASVLLRDGASQDFQFNNDLRQFITLAGEMGLFMYLRIGPYICAETQFGGYPPWITYSECTWQPAHATTTRICFTRFVAQSPTWSRAPAAAVGRMRWAPSSTAPCRTCGTCLQTAEAPSSWRRWRTSCTAGACVPALDLFGGRRKRLGMPPPPPPPQ